MFHRGGIENWKKLEWQLFWFEPALVIVIMTKDWPVKWRLLPVGPEFENDCVTGFDPLAAQGGGLESPLPGSCHGGGS